MNLTKKRWGILASSCLINLCIGSLYGWSVFAGPMAEYLNTLNRTTVFSAATLSVAFTVANAVGPVTMISGGYMNDRLGPGKVIFAGGILYGCGMILSGFAVDLTLLIAGYGFGCGLGMGLVYGCTIGNSVKFFPDKRGLAGGVVTAAYGLSSVILPPIANKIISSVGAERAFKMIGVVFLLVICIASFFVKKCPAGFCPDGWQPKEHSTDVQKQEKDWKAMLQDPIFYIMLFMLSCGAFLGLMIISQASPMAQNLAGISAAQAAIVVSVIALFNAAGRVGAGIVSDKIGRINTIRISLIVAILGIILLFWAEKGISAAFYTGVALVGICFGSFMGVFPGFTAEQFGSRHNTVNYGIMFIGFALAGVLGPVFISRIYEATGAYTKAFWIAGILAVAGLLLSFLYYRLSRKIS